MAPACSEDRRSAAPRPEPKDDIDTTISEGVPQRACSSRYASDEAVRTGIATRNAIANVTIIARFEARLGARARFLSIKGSTLPRKGGGGGAKARKPFVVPRGSARPSPTAGKT